VLRVKGRVAVHVRVQEHVHVLARLGRTRNLYSPMEGTQDGRPRSEAKGEAVRMGRERRVRHGVCWYGHGRGGMVMDGMGIRSWDT
jgi:hypothetical protein